MADPWMKFYTVDWMGEPKLKLVSRAARSLWIDMLCLMHQAGTGRLEMAGRPMTEKELAAVLGDNPRTTRKLLAELAAARVSVVVDGSFVASSRMIEDVEKLEKDRSNGRKGGNPDIKTKGKPDKGVNPPDKAKKPETKAKATSSKEVEGYQDYLQAPPTPVDSDAGLVNFSELVAGGVDSADIIAAAAAYASTVKGWSAEAKVQQSDNFICPERGKWKAHIPKSKPQSSEADVLAFYAETVLAKKRSAASTVSSAMAGKLVAAKLVTPQQLSDAGVSL